MSSTDYAYDEQGQFFPYFILVITSLVTLPTTYSVLKKGKELENTAPRIKSDFKPEHADLIERQRRKQKRRERKLKRIIFSVLGWLMMVWMVYLIVVTAASIPKIWDPYDVLGISMTADEKAIKRHYKKLAITEHPDKREPDASKNETVESINNHWVEIVKAYKALTDEDIRKNFLEYGHPDGKQSFSIGIALPKFIIMEGNGKYVLMLYGLLLGILLPYTVGSWWYGTQKMTKDKVLVASAGNLFREYDAQIDEGGVIAALSSGEEYEDMLPGAEADRGLATLEKRLLSESEDAPSVKEMGLKDRTKLTDLDDGYRRKALGLLWAYLSRTELGDQKLNDQKFEAAPIAHALVESFSSICLAYGNIQPLTAVYKTSQNIIQAVLPGSSPLLQLPHFTPKVVRAIEGDARTHMTLQKFMEKPDAERKRLVVQNGLLSSTQYSSAMNVASQMPVLKVEKAYFRVNGEKCIIPNSLIQFVVKARIVPPGSTNVPPVTPADLEDEADDRTEQQRDKENAVKVRIQPQIAHAPYFARDHSPRWHVFLGDNKQGKIAVPPFTFGTFDKPLFKEDGTPTFAIQTLQMQFGAPPQPGQYTFAMHCICDSYVGFDTKMDVVMVVEDASKAEAMGSDDDISEPDEDSIAGQMNALKGGQAAPKKKRAAKDDSDESDTEGDVETQSETDTDTDSDMD